MMRKVVLYRLVTDENGKSHYVRVKGRKKPEGRLGSYYLRYRENGKRKWESVGRTQICQVSGVGFEIFALKIRRVFIPTVEIAENGENVPPRFRLVG